MKTLFACISVIFLLLLPGCSDKKKEGMTEVSAMNGIYVYLAGDRTRVKLPEHYKRSSRYRLEEDLPALAADSLGLFVVQNNLEMMEFEDDEIDVFVDTLSKFNMLIIIDFDNIPLSKELGGLLSAQIKNRYEQLDFSIPEIAVQKITSNLKSGNNISRLKFKYKIEQELTGDHNYNTTYVLSTNKRSYIIFEISKTEADIEPYLWTIKET